MPEENVAPLAVVLPPSTMPYQFTELANPRGDFDAVVAPGETVNPKGMAYHPQLDALLLSLSPFRIQLDQRVQVMNRMERNGKRARFADGYTMYRAVESKIAIAPPNEFVIAAGFTPGEVFVGRGPTTQISRLSAEGAVLDDVFSEFGDGSVWGALAFDTEARGHQWPRRGAGVSRRLLGLHRLGRPFRKSGAHRAAAAGRELEQPAQYLHTAGRAQRPGLAGLRAGARRG